MLVPLGKAPTWLFHGKLMMLLFILRLQVWIMYYRFLNKIDSCFNNTGGRPQMANIKGVQSLYCSGLDLEIYTSCVFIIPMLQRVQIQS